MTAGRAWRRTPLFVAGSVAGFTGLIAWHSVGAGPPLTAGSGGAGAAGRSGPAATAGPGAGTRHAGHAGHHGTSSPRAPAGQAVHTATGPRVNFGYGRIAVKVTMRGTRITAVSVAALQVLEPTSQQISAQAIPILRSEVLSAQSARISGVSGASYTSIGYDRSLQGALDALHA